MNNQTNKILVPSSIRYFGDWGEGFEFPRGIIHKGPTGCGATTAVLTDGHPSVLLYAHACSW